MNKEITIFQQLHNSAYTEEEKAKAIRFVFDNWNEISEKIGKVDLLFALNYVIDIATKYQTIGTIEEFKTLKEKSVAEKVIARKGVEHTFYFCPKCKLVVGNSFTGDIAEHCKCCGQKLDWQ